MWPCTLPSLPLFIWDLCRPYWALPVTYPPNYEVEFEVIGVASLVSWPVLHNELCLPQDPLPICWRWHCYPNALQPPMSTKEPHLPDSSQT